MEEYYLENGIKLSYVHTNSMVNSFCIGLDAGANREKEYEIGLAHIVEHILFKGTKTRTEEEINRLCDTYLGFNNAMTNYPYSIYYGTTINDYFDRAIDIYSDIIINPILAETGFKEEIKVILEELQEWKDDNDHFCEDELFSNSFSKRRIQKRIIGESLDIQGYTLLDAQSFYNKYYQPDNCNITVVTSMKFEEVINIINKYFAAWKGKSDVGKKDLYEENIEGIYTKKRGSINIAKIQYCFTIHNLNSAETACIYLLNTMLGQGVSSILYDELRTKNSLVYDTFSEIRTENGIKLLNIKTGTSMGNIEKVLFLIDNILENIKVNELFITDAAITRTIKKCKLVKEISLEKSLDLAKYISINNVMFNGYEPDFLNKEYFDAIDSVSLRNVLCKTINKPSIQIIRS